MSEGHFRMSERSVPGTLTRLFHAELKVGTPRCGVPAPCRRGTGVLPSDQFVALGTECSAAERGGDGAARHPYLGFVASRGNAHEISELELGLVVLTAVDIFVLSQIQRVDFNRSVVRPLTVLLFFLLFGFGDHKTRAVSGKADVRNAMLCVESMEIFAGGCVEEGQVPVALKKPAGHGKEFPGWMKCQR